MARWLALRVSTTGEAPFISLSASVVCTSTPWGCHGARRVRRPGSTLRLADEPMLCVVQGILGGTFDPPHNAHLAIARVAYTQLGLDVVRLMPAGDPWQKVDSQVSPGSDRIAMTELLAEEDGKLVADGREILREGPSYTIDTIEEFGERHVLIMGADAALGIPTWHRSGEVLDRVDLAIVPRSGISTDDVHTVLGRSVRWLEMDSIDLSSTKVRDLVSRGLDHRDLVPQSVFDYIVEHGLYRPRDSRRDRSLSS